MFLELGGGNGLSYEYHPPGSEGGHSFVCFNPLTGDKSMWMDGIGPVLMAAGHGILAWNLRGQHDSPFEAGQIHEDNIIADAAALLQQLKPPNPVFVGLSVGGLYAAKLLVGARPVSCRALVLINTLRELSPRIAWVNTALVQLAATGGLELLRDVYLPLLMNEDWQQKNRQDFLTTASYQPLEKSDGALQLLKAGEATSWDVDWAKIKQPVLNITGAQDRIFRDEPVIKRLLQRIPQVTALNYTDAGHMIPAEQPARLASDILQFVGAI